MLASAHARGVNVAERSTISLSCADTVPARSSTPVWGLMYARDPTCAWRIIATRTLDTRIAELIDSKGGLAARALDGSEIESSSVDVQLEALVALLTDALEQRGE